MVTVFVVVWVTLNGAGGVAVVPDGLGLGVGVGVASDDVEGLGDVEGAV